MTHRLTHAFALLGLCFGLACGTTPGLTVVATPASIAGDGQSAVTVTAKVTAGGAPAPDGTTVHFTSTDGILVDASNTPGTTALAIDVTSTSGAAIARLIAPRRGRGTITVTASSSFNGATVTESQTVSLTPSGGLASSLTLTCTSQNVGGLVTGLSSPIHVLCTPVASDAQGRTITNASIEAYAEAGILAWETDPQSGNQALIYTISPGATPPVDVDPFGPDGNPRPVCPTACINDPTTCDAEPCWSANGKTHNPRDGVATLMVAVPGTPGFADPNSDGEPFVDADDDGVRGQTELFIDVNGDGKYESSTDWGGAMQSPRMLWKAFRIVWSGSADTNTTTHSSAIQAQPSASGTALNNLIVRLNDSNYNKLAATTSDDGFTLSSVCDNDGSLNGTALESTFKFDITNPGIVFDPSTGSINGPGRPSTYRSGTDINTQASGNGSITISGNTQPATCTITASVTRTYDPGAEPPLRFERHGLERVSHPRILLRGARRGDVAGRSKTGGCSRGRGGRRASAPPPDRCRRRGRAPPGRRRSCAPAGLDPAPRPAALSGAR